jgi:hypothetical protein
VPATSSDLVTAIDVMADRRGGYESPGASPLHAEPANAVVERGWSPAEVAPSTLVTGTRGTGTVLPAVSSGSAPVQAGAAAPADQFHDKELSGQSPSGFPPAPFSAAGTSGGASVVGSSGGTAAGAIVPGTTCHDDVFVVSGIVVDGVCPVRQFALAPQVSPA